MNKRYDTILFDLDGTLTDPGLGITSAVMYSLEKLGLPVPERTELYKFIGPPLIASYRDFYGFSQEKAKEAAAIYREYYGERGLWENRVYDGIPEQLAALRADGRRLCVATSKPEPFAVRIMERFGLARYFEHICGATMDEKRDSKHLVIEYALEVCGVTDRRTVLMVGDRKHDILGAKESGLDSMGVLYGYGSRDELIAAGADHIAPSVADIGRILEAL